ncbi:MAG: trypsin-like peptidase domain-containing protein [Parcubacteria group bacterium]|nr:trypsin-like peptidase domain-containing protein [Parcubacteria group bacterium]
MDEVKIYDKALTNSEVLTLYSGPVVPASAPTPVPTPMPTPAPAPTPAPIPTQPYCSEDTWSCNDWGSCSSQGTQTRSCRRTFDCSMVEDPAPATSRSCTPPETSPTPNQSENINREQILNATVKLLCPIDKTWGNLGSGTVIDEYGTILTNRHLLVGTIGVCAVGFINGEDDIPFSSSYEIADIKSISTDTSENGDIALLKIRNPGNRKFTAVDIFRGNSDTLRSGDTILPFGYPDQNYFGETITFTEGSYSGKGTTMKLPGTSMIDVRSFFKTTATIDHGNSGGGAYQKKTGFFVGIPTLGTSLDPNIPSRINYILSINTIKKWLSSLGSNYNVSSNNFTNFGNYLNSSIKIEDVNVSTLKALDAPTPVEIISGNFEKKRKGQKVVIQKSSGDSTIATPITLPLSRGMRNSQVTRLQFILAQSPEIYPEGLVTGYFGPATERAVKRFQKSHGLEQVGFVGPKTRALLNAL